MSPGNGATRVLCPASHHILLLPCSNSGSSSGRTEQQWKHGLRSCGQWFTGWDVTFFFATKKWCLTGCSTRIDSKKIVTYPHSSRKPLVAVPAITNQGHGTGLLYLWIFSMSGICPRLMWGKISRNVLQRSFREWLARTSLLFPC